METVKTTPTYEAKPGKLQTFRTSAWLGWMIESNWTDPFIFAVYSIIRPILTAAILIVMYLVIRGGDFSSADFVNLYIGNAFYILVGAAIQRVSFGIIDDREHYRTLKYIFIAPLQVPVYLIGRSVASILVSCFSVLFTLGFGILFLKMPIVLAEVKWGLFVAAFFLGMAVMMCMGLILGGWTLIIKNNPWSLGDSMGAGLLIFSGAVFPLSVLPTPLQWIGNALPISYWLALIRRALVPEIGRTYPMYTNLSDLQLLLILLAFTLLYAVLAVVVYKRFDIIARERGNIDMVSNY
ncbi:MAG TPA: ABC transporter permease [Anaerolineaceae bacterium]|nr:ABC transporter permease [Anaerolineaceae bacterium]